MLRVGARSADRHRPGLCGVALDMKRAESLLAKAVRPPCHDSGEREIDMFLVPR